MSTVTPTEPDVDISHRELLYRVYALFYNKAFGLGLIIAMTVLSLLGVLFQQAPPEALEDPSIYAQWLDSVRPRYRGLTDALSALQVFRMFTSWAWRIVVVLLVLSIIACTVHRIPTLWRNATAPHLNVRESLFDKARIHRDYLIDARPAEALAALEPVLSAKGYRQLKSDEHNVYADKYRFMPLGTALAHAAFCLILLGFLVTANFGFEEKNFVVPVAAGPVEVGHGTGLAIEAKSFTDSYNADGRPMDYASELVLHKDGQPVKEHLLRVNTPVAIDGVKIHQASFGFAAQMKVTDAKGTKVYAGAVPLEFQTQDQRNVFGMVKLPGTELEMYVISNASGVQGAELAPGQLQVELYKGGQDKVAVASEVLDQGKERSVQDYLVTFERERQYTSLLVSKDYGAPLVWTGSVLLMLGTVCTMFLRHKRLWLRLHPEGQGTRVRLACPDRHDITFGRSLDEMLAGAGARPLDTTQKSAPHTKAANR